MFDKLISVHFTEEGVDWIDYYLYENPEKCYYQNKVKIPLETLDDLWENIKVYRKFSNIFLVKVVLINSDGGKLNGMKMTILRV